MKAGVVYPQTEFGGDTGAVKAFAQAAEHLGYDHIVIYDPCPRRRSPIRLRADSTE